MKLLHIALASALALSLAACGGGGSDAAPADPGGNNAGGNDQAVTPAAAYTVEGVFSGAAGTPVPGYHTGNVLTNYRLAMDASHAVMQIGAAARYVLDRGTGLWVQIDDQAKTANYRPLADSQVFSAALAEYLFPLDFVQAAGAQRSSATSTLAGLRCDVWKMPGADGGSYCITPDNILLQDLSADGTQNFRALWVDKGNPDLLTSVPDTYADNYGPGNGSFQVLSWGYGQALAFTGKSSDPVPGIRAGLLAVDQAPAASSPQAFKFIRFDGATPDAARYLICGATSTPALASCLVPNASSGGPVAMQLLSWQAGQPPAAALWQLQLANGGKSPGLTKPYNILNAQNPTLALQATSAGGGYAVSMAALTTSTYFDWTFKTLTLP